MLLLDACESLYFPRSLSIRSEETRRQYRLAIADFGKTLERVPDVTDLTDDNLALLYRWLLDVRKVCIVTANERVGRLKALGDFLWKRGYIPHGITLGRMRAPRRTPCAWQRDEIRRLLIACRNFKGHLGGVPACAWWRAHLAWLWATGARVGETLALRWEWIDFTHKVAHVPAEVRKGQSGDMLYHLPDWLLAELQRIKEPARDLVFPFPRTKGSMYHRWSKLLRWASVSPERRKAHKMRVSHATWIEVFGGDAQRSLGHRGREVTDEHYIDPRFFQGQRVEMPPPMDE